MPATCVPCSQPEAAHGRAAPAPVCSRSLLGHTELDLFAAEAGVGVEIDGQSTQVMGRYDCLHLEAGGALAEVKLNGGACCLIELTPR